MSEPVSGPEQLVKDDCICECNELARATHITRPTKRNNATTAILLIISWLLTTSYVLLLYMTGLDSRIMWGVLRSEFFTDKGLSIVF